MNKSNEEIELKPCPFCGRIPDLIINGAGDFITDHNESDCAFNGSGWSPEVWNTRRATSEQEERIRELEDALKAADDLIEEYDRFNANAYMYGKIKHYQVMYERAKEAIAPSLKTDQDKGGEG